MLIIVRGFSTRILSATIQVILKLSVLTCFLFKNKLAKIRELTGMNLSTLDARIQLATGLMLHDIL